jgi:hypothetical protein
VLVSKNNEAETRGLRAKAIEIKKLAVERSEDLRNDEPVRKRFAESAQWITLWLQSPELFENWVKLRRASPDFRRNFQITE